VEVVKKVTLDVWHATERIKDEYRAKPQSRKVNNLALSGLAQATGLSLARPESSKGVARRTTPFEDSGRATQRLLRVHLAMVAYFCSPNLLLLCAFAALREPKGPGYAVHRQAGSREFCPQNL
jgi:hypothetical protein